VVEVLHAPQFILNIYISKFNIRYMQHFQRRDRGEKRESNQMVFGIRAVIEAIDSGKEIESLFIQRGLTGSLVMELKDLLKKHGIGTQTVPIEKLNRITRRNHQGVIA